MCLMMKSFLKHRSNIKTANKLSWTTYNKLSKIRDFISHRRSLDPEKNTNSRSISMKAKVFITIMIKPPKAPTNIRRIWEAVYNKFGEKYSSHILKRFIKEELRYNFKKACSRPPKYYQPSTKIAKGLFWTELLRMIYNKKTIFSVDKWSFIRAAKMEYSWLPIGKSSAVVNDIWKGSASLMLSVGSNSQRFGVVKIGTVDSKIFSIFSDLLEKVLLKSIHNNNSVPVVILDNARVHTSHYTKTVMNNLKLEVWSTPPYCPEVAPVEHVFRAVKAKLRSRNPAQTIDFNKQSRMKVIKDCWVSLGKSTIQSAWTEVIKEWSEGIRSTVVKLNSRNL